MYIQKRFEVTGNVNIITAHMYLAAGVFYIFLVFSNARRVLLQCNTRFRLLYF